MFMTTKTVSVNDPVVKSIIEFGHLAGRQAVKGAFYQMIPFALHLPNQFSRDMRYQASSANKGHNISSRI